jgi:hypothetical protein
MVSSGLCLVGLCGSAVAADKLAMLIPNLYGQRGLIVDSEAPLETGETHSAHYNASFQQSFTPFNIALATQLASVQIPTPASGFTYTFDSSVGVFKRSTQSFGPIVSDRAETIGRRKVALGLHFQRFTFDSIDSVGLGDVPVVFTHDDAAPGGRADVVTTLNAIETTLNQTTLFATYGVSDRFDVSLGIPFVSVDLTVRSEATIQRIGTTDPAIHFFRTPDGGFGDRRTFASSGSASGLGDILLRAKGTVVKSGATGLALGLDVRLPTGDEEDLLGSGAASLKPFAALSYSHKTVSPHLKLAYQWTGDSMLAGNVVTGTKADLPDVLFYEAGADLSLASRLTIAVDVLGRRVIDGERLAPETFQALDGRSTFPNVRFAVESFSQLDGAIGVKVNPGGNLLLDLNVLFKLNDNGLRDKVTPLLGIEYSF